MKVRNKNKVIQNESKQQRKQLGMLNTETILCDEDGMHTTCDPGGMCAYTVES